VLLAGVGLPRAPLSPRHVADLAGITIEHILPFDPAVLRADADGMPVWRASPRSPYTQAIARLADAVTERLGQPAEVSR
jgi:MinD-like ATPase involved in chromosome partitioning or flagellar assembly